MQVLLSLLVYFSLNIFKYLTEIGEKRIEAHRIVLSAASDYFAAMFTNDFGESFQNEIELQAVDPDALETLVAYCYTGNLICCVSPLLLELELTVAVLDCVVFA